VADVEDIGEVVITKAIHQSGQQAVGGQGRRTVRDQGESLSFLTSGKAINPIRSLVAGRLGRDIHPNRKPHPTRPDDDCHQGFVGMEPDQIGDDSQEVVWPTDFEPRLRLRRLASTPFW
jgi:hypothetical protein